MNMMRRATIILAATLAVADAIDTDQPMRKRTASTLPMPGAISRPKRSRGVEDDLASNFLNMKVSI